MRTQGDIPEEQPVPSRGSHGLLALVFCFLDLPEDGLHSYVFPLAVLLAKGKRLALVPLYLGSLYARLKECA